MKELINFTEDAAQTMSSREIAEITGKEHRSVLRDIDNLNDNYEKMGLHKIVQGTYVHQINKQEYREYRLTRMQTFDLMTGYNVELRIKVNRRWEQLETQTSAQQLDFSNPATVLQLAQNWAQEQQRRIDAEQKAQILEGERNHYQAEVQQLAPKAQYTDQVLQSTSTFTATQIAKGLDMSAISLNQKLKNLGIQFFQAGQWFLTSRYHNKGYTQMRVTKYIDRDTGEVKSAQTMVWTEKGRQFIHSLKNQSKL